MYCRKLLSFFMPSISNNHHLLFSMIAWSLFFSPKWTEPSSCQTFQSQRFQIFLFTHLRSNSSWVRGLQTFSSRGCKREVHFIHNNWGQRSVQFLQSLLSFNFYFHVIQWAWKPAVLPGTCTGTSVRTGNINGTRWRASLLAEWVFQSLRAHHYGNLQWNQAIEWEPIHWWYSTIRTSPCHYFFTGNKW